MEIIIQSPHFIVSEKLKDFAEAKAGWLLQYDGRIVKCDILLKLNKSETDKNKICEMILFRPKMELFASKESLTFEEAISEAVRAIEKQLKRKSAKMRNSDNFHSKLNIESD